MAKILGMPPPLLQPRYSNLSEEINWRYNFYKARLTREVEDEILKKGLIYLNRLSLDQRWFVNIILVENEELKLKEQLDSVVQDLKEIKVRQDEIDRDQHIKAL